MLQEHGIIVGVGVKPNVLVRVGVGFGPDDLVRVGVWV